ncbi:transcription factor Atoh8 [Neocloeon triangulifer]|uniref:transcription factor Atoh8 n=1 Tax=Neocloeon triangulifer TaxID=2078957 RepID=UPI00286F773D|nr:transcription factor Atoh8 [Neocloeon triangulifer]XP_059475687.1 transcription factor Atoh8 [Neocloeon triangulifer]
MMATEISVLGQHASVCVSDDDLHSPTDASDDSVEVKVHPILALSKKNKRKLAEPRKVANEGKSPPTKRARKLHNTTDLIRQAVPVSTPSPFRPWSEPPSSHHSDDQPLSLVVRPSAAPVTLSPALCGAKPTVAPPPIRKRLANNKFSVESLIGEQPPPQLQQQPTPPASAKSSKSRSSNATVATPNVQRNYKNMTRERRIEANARERTRVHTISAAFDTLRQTIPSYSNSQKLSKLSILRIACSYIVALSRVAGEDYSEGATAPSVPDCVEKVTKTIHAEGKVRKKKDE